LLKTPQEMVEQAAAPVAAKNAEITTQTEESARAPAPALESEGFIAQNGPN